LLVHTSLYVPPLLPPTPTLFPYTTLFRSLRGDRFHLPDSTPPSICGSRNHQPGVGQSEHSSGERGPNRFELAASGVSHAEVGSLDRKSTRLNSSHGSISYAVFCLKKKIRK